MHFPWSELGYANTLCIGNVISFLSFFLNEY